MEKYEKYVLKAKSMVKDPMMEDSKLATRAIHSGHVAFDHARTGHPLTPPISLSTTFSQEYPNCHFKYDYSRSGNYNREILETTVAAIENAKFCCVFSSGLATVSSIAQMLKSGDHLLYFNDVFAGTDTYFKKVASNFNLDIEAIDFVDIDKFKSSLKSNTKLVWIESPSNPMMRIVDISQISEISKNHNTEIIIVVDNTFTTPVFQMPIKFGADIVMYSLTKYMNGHSDVVMGAAAMNNREFYEQLQSQQRVVGAVPSPFDCYLALRGIRTLAIRMRQHQLNGLSVALYLADHPKIKRVLHPALLSSPDKELVERQMMGFSGMVSVFIKGSPDDVITFSRGLKIFQIAESLGGFESQLVIRPSIDKVIQSPDQRADGNFIYDIIRLSVGLEDIFTIIGDLEQALDQI